MLKPIRFFSAVISFLFLVIIPAWGETYKLSSQLSDVTVYPGSAHLTRTVTLDLASGDHTIVFDALTPPVDENTLSVSGEGTAQVKIYGGYIKQEYLEQSPNERVKEIQKKIQDIDDDLLSQNSLTQVLDQKREYLNSIKAYTGGQLPKEIVTTVPSVESIKGIGNYLSEEWTALEKERNDIRMKIRELNTERSTLVYQLNNLQGGQPQIQRHLAVDLGCTKPGKFTLRVAYLVGGASWHPVYDARTDFAKSQVELSSYGVIRQSTGEDWKEVRLTLSTAQPNIGGRMPYVSPWILQPFQPMMEERKFLRRDMAMKGAGVAAQYAPMEDAASMAMLQEKDKNELAQAPNAPAQMAFSDVTQKGLSVTFHVPRPVTLKSDGSETKVPVTTQTLKSEFQYSSYPRSSALSYLNSDVINSPEIPLLAGPVNLFLEGDFVGKSDILAAAPGEKFSLYLGINENVKVKREQLSKKIDDILIAGIPSPNRTTTVKMKITVENYDAHKIKYNLFESMPIVENDKQIKVRVTDVNVEPTKKDWNDRKGVWQWIFDLDPKAKKEITYTYIVEHPRDMQISGL